MIEAAWRWGAACAAPGLRLMLRRRAARGKEVQARLAEREGIDPSPRPPGRLLWLHAASVGEAVSVLPLLASLARQAPALTVLFTTGTVTSARLLQRRLPELGLTRVLHRFAPLDVPSWAARFLDHWRPDAAAFVESELWPNLLAACRRRGIPMLLLNGRMSARSFARWRRLDGFARGLIGSFDVVHAQSDAYAERLAKLGARRLLPPGNLKWAAPPLIVDEQDYGRLRALIGARPVWLAASTHPGEEALVGAVHRTLSRTHPSLLTIVAPRHPERGAVVAASLAEEGRGVARRRSEADPSPETGLFVVDTMGELGLFYRLSPIVFMGGSLVPHGGQNPLEAARFGCALAAGPHTANFSEIVARLQHEAALCPVQDAAGLAGFVGSMLSDAGQREAMGQAARAVADGEKDLPDRLASAVLDLVQL